MIRTAVIGLLAILIFVNLYFRTKVLKYYKKLDKIELPLRSRHILSRKKLEEEILKTNEPDRENIEGFVNQIRRLMLYVVVLFFIIVCLSMFLAIQD